MDLEIVGKVGRREGRVREEREREREREREEEWGGREEEGGREHDRRRKRVKDIKKGEPLIIVDYVTFVLPPTPLSLSLSQWFVWVAVSR